MSSSQNLRESLKFSKRGFDNCKRVFKASCVFFPIALLGIIFVISQVCFLQLQGPFLFSLVFFLVSQIVFQLLREEENEWQIDIDAIKENGECTELEQKDKNMYNYLYDLGNILKQQSLLFSTQS